MKVEFIDDQSFYIYLNKQYLPNLELDNKKCVEEYFKKIFVNLKNCYHLDIYGYYNIRVYHNMQYGIIIDVFKLSNDYFKTPGNKVDMKIMIDTDNPFLYEVEDYFFTLPFRNGLKDVYYKEGKCYLKLNDEVDNLFYLYLMEHGRIVFDDEAYEILTSGIKTCYN